ncbi:MAG: ABC transporter ATP-binding protein [Cyanobacteriota bacterium]|nr:ABC transporter ATP-binding protein [Cyanobacteriota bacterium]
MTPEPNPAQERTNGTPLRIQQLSFAWPNGRPALQHCDLQIPRPGLWMLVGGNGSGKSTLLRLVAGLLQPTSGSISYASRPALVFQNPDHQLLLPSCGSDLQLGLPDGLSRLERRQAVSEAMERVGLAGLQDRPIHSLSGGQKQRLAIAAALASGSDLLLLDEPTALLDPSSQEEILTLLAGLCRRSDKPLTALWVTHRLEELQHCDGAALMERGAAGPWRDGPGLRRQLEQRRGALPSDGAKR